MRLFSIAVAAALLCGCAAPAPQPEPEPPAPAASTPPPPERAFPGDSFHDLLVAEFALRRRQYDLALDNYLNQAPALRDSGVSAHTTHLAQFLQRPEATLEAARLWVELSPGDLEARNTLARELVRAGHNVEALPHLAAIERAGETANFPILLNAFTQLPEADRAALVDGIDTLAREFPEDAGLLLTRAMMQYELGRDEPALATLDELFELQPEQVQGLLLEARIRSSRGDPEPYARIERILAENPDNRGLRLRYARLLTNTDMRAARKQFEILSAQAPEDADLIFSLALINREMGDPLTAGAYLRQLIDQGQRVNEAHYYLGRIEEERNSLEAALDHYQSVGPGSEYLAANHRIGEILIGEGEFARSGAWFESQRELFPDQAERLFGLEAELLGDAGEGARAMDLLDGALRENPGVHSLLYSRAMLFEQQGDLAAMESDLRTVIDADPDNATALNALGYTLANRTERHEEALALISRALELQPGEPAILDSMGWVLFRLGRYPESLDYLTRAFTAFPDAEVAAHLGEVMWVMGDKDGARSVWRAAAARDPDHPVLTETLRRLGVALGDPPGAPDGADPGA